jgi:hypothetical protein
LGFTQPPRGFSAAFFYRNHSTYPFAIAVLSVVVLILPFGH